jgi:RimJ/RimL family protein N-acetyltransferase
MLVYGQDRLVAEWVAAKLGLSGADDFMPCVAIGIVRDDRLVAGVVYNNYQTDREGSPLSIEMTIASTSPRWASRKVLTELFEYPFIQLRVKRVQALTSVGNAEAQSLLKRLGFSQEGVHRCAYSDGEDAVSWGMLKHECKWMNNGQEIT